MLFRPITYSIPGHSVSAVINRFFFQDCTAAKLPRYLGHLAGELGSVGRACDSERLPITELRQPERLMPNIVLISCILD